MARNKLTAIEVKNGEGKLFDGAGLYLLKREPDKGRWVYRYKHQGRSREMGLGPFPAVSLSDARAARDQWAEVLREGGDPIAERDRRAEDERRAATRNDPTFAEAAEITFEARKAGLRMDGEAGRWMSPLTLYMIPAIGHLQMSEIHQADIQGALAPIWKKKHPTAEKALQRTRIVFRHMRLSGVECDPFTVDMAQHMLGEVRHKTVKTRASAWQDIPRIFRELDKPSPAHLCLRFSILTAVRSDGVRGARFDEIDGDIWTVPADRMKGREGSVEDFRVPLSTAALDVIVHAEEWRMGSLLFPGRGGRNRITDVAVSKALAKVDPNGTPHGLRTSFRTWVQDTGAAPYDVAETALAHIIGGKVERSYARSDFLDRRRALMQVWADFVTGVEQKVVPIRVRH